MFERTFAIPVDGVLQTVHVGVLRLDENVFVDATAETQNVGHVVLFLLQRFLHHVQRSLAIAFAIAPIEGEGVQVPNGRRRGVVAAIGHSFQILDQQDHGVVILHLSAVTEKNESNSQSIKLGVCSYIYDHLPKRYQHIEDNVSAEDIRIVKSLPHRLQSIDQAFTAVGLACFAQIG